MICTYLSLAIAGWVPSGNGSKPRAAKPRHDIDVMLLETTDLGRISQREDDIWKMLGGTVRSASPLDWPASGPPPPLGQYHLGVTD
eukprot:SAG25_NODE_390_length_8662_cov_4.211141_7_plen_86_part_00